VPDAPAKQDRSFWWALGLVTAGALALRLVYVVGFRADVVFGGDSYFYDKAANLLADGKGFLNPFFSMPGHPYQSADHPPLYWLYLAFASRLGFDTSLGHMVWSTFVGAGAVWATGLAGRAMVGARTGIVAAVLAAVYPNVWSWDGMVLSETMALLTVSLALWTAYRYRRAPTVGNAALLGTATALAMLSRAEFALMVLIVVVPAILLWGDRATRARLVRLAAAGLAVVVLVGPWVGYNLSRFEEPVFLSTGFEVTLLSASCHNTYYGPYIGYWTQDCPKAVRGRIPTDRPLDESQKAKYFRTAALRFIDHHRGRLPVVTLARWGRITHLFRPWQQASLDWFPEGRPLGVARAGLFSWYALAPAALAGVLVLRRRRIPDFPVVAPLAIVLFTVTVTFAQVRYRAAAESAFVLLAAVAIDALLARATGRARGHSLA
jgi:4-amino-4-deoxy-L-arabinose transferase-like glycosyltransferase